MKNFIVGSLAITFIVTVGVLFFQYQNRLSSVSAEFMPGNFTRSPSPNMIFKASYPTQATASTEVRPVEWQTFESPEQEFSMQYLSEMEVNMTQSGAVGFLLLGPTQTASSEFIDGIRVAVITADIKGKNFSEFVLLQRQGVLAQPIRQEVSDVESIEVAGNEGYQFSVIEKGEITHVYVLLEDTRYAHITYQVEDPGQLGFRELTLEMLESIGFEN